MRRPWIITLVVVVVVALGSAVGVVEYLSTHRHAATPQGESRPLTLDEVESQARVAFPDGSKLLFGEFYVLDDWAVAARVQFDRKGFNDFLSASGLPNPVVGLRPVPLLPGVSTDAPQPSDAPSDGPAPSGGAAPGDSAAPSGAAAPAPTPSSLPSPAVPLLRDDPGWHPEKVAQAAGMDRVVQDGVARWVMIDLDDQNTVIVYLYAVADQPVASAKPSTTASRSPAGA